MLKFLLNGNLSWETKNFLKKLGFNVKMIADCGLSRAKDREILEFAQKHDYIIITLDLDFGEIYYFADSAQTGIIILKLTNQTVESVNRALKILLSSGIFKRKSARESLIIFDGKKIRIRKK